MADFYADLQAVASDVMSAFKQGTVTLTRKSYATPSRPSMQNGAVTSTVYTLDATVRGVQKQYIDESLIVASDLQITMSPRATNASGARVTIVPALDDIITVGGRVQKLKKVLPVPASGTPVVYMLFVGA